MGTEPTQARRLLVVVEGGRHDGAEILRSRLPPPFVWVDDDLRLWMKSRLGAELHRCGMIRKRNGVTRYVLKNVHRTHLQCPGCGAIHSRTDSCSLCGHSFLG